MPPLQRIVVLYLVGIFPGDRLTYSWPQLSLDMAPTSFDDQYKGCEDKMAANLKELNRTEFDNNRIFAKAWQLAEREISLSPPAGLKQEYAIALAAYTIQQPNLYEVFNKAVTEAGKNTDYYLNSFHFKTFHFLLTRAIQVLGAKAAPKCYSVYRGVKKFLVPGGSKMIRFGHFTSSSLKREVALQFGEDTFFTIETCRGVSIKAISFYPEEDEVLIPPYEKFEVIKFTKTPNTNFIHLRSLGESTTYNCVFVKGGSGSHLSTNLEAPFLLWGFLLFAGGLGAPGLL